MKIREPKGIITTESPDIHWGFLPVRFETILDLGDGLNSEFTPTPVYWIQNGASQVYGVDSSQQSYDWYKQNFNVKNFLHIQDWVDSLEKFTWYFNASKPSVVKIDTEGSEIFLMGMSSKLVEGVKHIGIEYHNLSALLSCEYFLRDNGYEIEYYKFEHLDIDYQGVIHGKKVKQWESIEE